MFKNRLLYGSVVYFLKFLTPFIFEGRNFLNSILFLAIFSLLDAPIGGVQVFLNIRNNGTLPLDLACLECLSVIIATNEQQKDVTHMLCF